MQSPPVSAMDVETIERATVAAVAPQRLQELAHWLLPMDSGTIGRAKSAVPLRHVDMDDALIAEIEERYGLEQFAPRFRLPVLPPFDRIKQSLAKLGYAAGRPTAVQVAELDSLLALGHSDGAILATSPDIAWAELFLGEGFDPVDGTSRVKSLSRASGTLFASVREQGRTMAAGAAAFSHGWVSVHGMRTERAQRGRGLAGRILSCIAAEARRRGLRRIFLQVEEGNQSALALYRRAGFATVWRYEYWSKA